MLHTPAFIMLCHNSGHNSVLFVIALILVALSAKMCCCSLVLCAPDCGVIRNPYYVIIWAAVLFALMLLIVVKNLWYLR